MSNDSDGILVKQQTRIAYLCVSYDKHEWSTAVCQRTKHTDERDGLLQLIKGQTRNHLVTFFVLINSCLYCVSARDKRTAIVDMVVMADMVDMVDTEDTVTEGILDTGDMAAMVATEHMVDIVDTEATEVMASMADISDRLIATTNEVKTNEYTLCYICN